jgi:hypothetical protein
VDGGEDVQLEPQKSVVSGLRDSIYLVYGLNSKYWSIAAPYRALSRPFGGKSFVYLARATGRAGVTASELIGGLITTVAADSNERRSRKCSLLVHTKLKSHC